jgi:tetratricopeptide (TPR) repeat protein
MRFISLVLATLAVPLASLGTEQDPTVQLVQERAAAARFLSRSPEGAAALIRLHELKDEVEDLRPIARTEQELAYGVRINPFTRAEARLLLLDLERSRGQLPKAVDLNHQLGFMHDFYVLGGFDNEGKDGCKRDFGPEKSVDLGATYSGKSHELGWHPLHVDPLDGFMDLGAVVRPNHEAVAYALTFLQVPRPRRAVLSLGSSGAHRLWVNGQLVHSDDLYHPARTDQVRVEVALHKGLNAVMVKVCQETGLFGFYLRSEGGALLSTLPEKYPSISKGAGEVRSLPTLTSVLEREVKSHPKDALKREAYATVLHHHRAFDEKEHLDAATAEEAALLARAQKLSAQEVADLEALAGKLQVDDFNKQRQHFDAALAQRPDFPEVEALLAVHELGTGHADRARDRLLSTLSRHPAYAQGELILSRAEEELGDWPGAAERVEHVLHDAPQLPNAARESARVARRLERASEALDRFRVAVALRYDDANSRRSLAALLAETAHVDEAEQELRTLVRLDPFDNGSRLKLSELTCANGQLEEGLAAFAEAKALSPDDPELYEREGRALLLNGRRHEAIKSFERALALRPQNPGLREVMHTLEGDDSASGAQYAFDLRPLVREADSYESEDAVVLGDYTYTRVQSSGLSSAFRQLGVKVYTERGVEAFRTFPITYSPARPEVVIVKARITKPDGAVLDGFGENERAINEPWTGMYYDARAKVLSFPSLAKGDVLELMYRIEDTAQDNLLSDYWGDVDFLQGPYPKVRYQFLVDMPEGRPLYWNVKSLGPGVESKKEPLADKRVLYSFRESHVAKVVPEPNMPGWAEVATTLHVSTYKTWDQVGHYYWGLVNDQLTPNEELRRTVDTVLKGVNRKDTKAVVKAIYNFVVTNTRYVALEFGIHGYKPYRVDRILARRFGDCKDKASLIHALLKVAGVDSRLVLLRMRHLGALGEEPASLAAFNHAIAYVPSLDLYLDGTAEFSGSSELPSADRAANVLIVEPTGQSRFLTTPEAPATDNVTELDMDVLLKHDGSAAIHGGSTVAGQGASEYRRSYQSAATRKAMFEQGWAQLFPGLSVKKMALSDITKLDRDVTLDYDLAVPRYAEVLQGGLRFSPFGSSRSYTQAYAPLVERHYDLVMPGPWMNTFHFHYNLPKGYSVASLPKEVHEETPFGSLTMTFKTEDGKLSCDGQLAFSKARIAATDYPAFRAFVGRVDEAFARKVTLTAKEVAKLQ